MGEVTSRPYWEAVETFLRDLQDRDVRSVVLVGLLRDEDTHNVCVMYDAGPFELSDAAGILQLAAAKKYLEVNRDEEET